MKAPLCLSLIVPFLGIPLLLLPISAAEVTAPPNIIFILSDDQGYGDVSALNPESKIPTPHIDRIAQEGMIFSDAHSSSSVCTPTRYSILTGRYHWRTHLQKGVLGGFSRPLISQDTPTLPAFLRENGYHTACIGKWHLGLDWKLKNGETADDGGDFSSGYQDGWKVDYTQPIQNGPVDRGFDHFFGISASLDMPPYVYIHDRIPTEVATVEKAFHRKGPSGAEFEAADVLPRFTEATVTYIEERAGLAKAGIPFFIYMPLNAPHTPIVPSEEWAGKSGINIYADFTMQVDHSVGQVLSALDAEGISENTIVIFTTDNGCSPRADFAELEAAGHKPSLHFRGHKADIFEGGHRVPFLVRWPARIKAGSTSNLLIGQYDFFRTCADLLNQELPPEAAEDSVSFLAAFDQEEPSPPRESLIAQSIGGQFSIRKNQWKLNLCPGSGGWSNPRPGRADLSGLPPVQL
ncbi:MAG: arylsulfatase, partial [Verrucomicrobiota bacterium]